MMKIPSYILRFHNNSIIIIIVDFFGFGMSGSNRSMGFSMYCWRPLLVFFGRSRVVCVDNIVGFIILRAAVVAILRLEDEKYNHPDHEED